MKKMIGAAVIFVLTAMLLVTATAFDATYYKRLQDLVTKALLLQGDILNVQKGVLGGNAGTCLDDLRNILNAVESQMGFLHTLAFIASSMNDKSDEQMVVGQLQFEAKTFLEAMQIHRNGVNLNIGACSRYGVVAVKGQEILQLFNEATSLVRLMAK